VSHSGVSSSSSVSGMLTLTVFLLVR
jgi:hypothetical protein